jgi:hypothetical protein
MNLLQVCDVLPTIPSHLLVLTALTEQWRKRILFIVCLRRSRSYEAIKTALGGLEDEPALINWDTNKIDYLPKPSIFVRHFAVCLIPLEFWNDPTKSILQKFQSATYWELAIISPRLWLDGVWVPYWHCELCCFYCYIHVYLYECSEISVIVSEL